MLWRAEVDETRECPLMHDGIACWDRTAVDDNYSLPCEVLEWGRPGTLGGGRAYRRCIQCVNNIVVPSD